jgi:NhaP-type Na+/H+ or K+/H+ antiporter
VTWLLAGLGAHFIVGIEPAPAVLLGAILVVSGPTVIIPLLRQVRPKGNVGSIVKWEGIVNDPIGAILAVLVFEVILQSSETGMTIVALVGVTKAIVFGGLLGLAGAAIVVLLLKRYLIPDFLQNPVTLMLVVTAYVGANAFQTESGLLAVTVMGVTLANQKYVSIKGIVEFKETLRVLLISSLFIILAGRMTMEHLALFDTVNWLFVAFLILIARPAMVWLSTIGSKLTWRERGFLAWVAPRGIVAAAVVSVFAIRLSETGFAGSDRLVPLTFQVIIGTVAVYGLTAPAVARLLKVAKPSPQGVLFAGAQSWVLDMARLLRDEGFRIVLVDSNWSHVAQARKVGCSAHYSNILSEHLLYDLSLDGVGRLLALTPNDEVNSLAVLHFADIFSSSEVYQLPPMAKSYSQQRSQMPRHLQGRYLFSPEANFGYFVEQIAAGAVIKKTPITDEFTYEDYREIYGKTALPLFIINESGNLEICTAADGPMPKSGDKLIGLVNEPVDE